MKSYKKILVPTDLTESCAVAAQQAKQIAEAFGGEVNVLHIIDYLPPAYVAVELPAEFASKKFVVERATASLNEWADKNGLSDCNKVVDTGHPKKTILKQIKDLEPDLVVLAPHHEDGLSLFFGSVTNAVAQSADVDILIARP